MTIEAGFINTPETQQRAINQRNAITLKAEVGSIKDNVFKYFAAFDGSNNDELASNGDTHTTNVRQLYEQATRSESINFKTGYFRGPGTEGTLVASSWLSPQVTKQVISTVEAAYTKFNEAAANVQ